MNKLLVLVPLPSSDIAASATAGERRRYFQNPDSLEMVQYDNNE